jgi:hypothetical protein
MFDLSDYIDPLIFLIALCLGLFYTYITAPAPHIIIKYPTPFNAGKITYVDNNNVCYKYRIKKVECPDGKNDVKTYKFDSGEASKA